MAAETGEDARKPQLAYSEIQYKTYDETKRRTKAAKIRTVVEHFLDRRDLSGLVVVDVGCSTGYTADELRTTGATVIGLDIDVPGLKFADERFGAGGTTFLCADGTALPFADRSVDVVVFNHIYEHVVDPDQVLREISRVLKEDGLAYLGFGNRLGIIEPHYRLPFLSWLPHKAADRYISMTGKAPDYYERFRTRRGLLAMCAGLNIWDYTYTVLSDSEQFSAQDMVPERLRNLPAATWHLIAPVMPTFIWVGTPGRRVPSGAGLRAAPRRLYG